MDLSVLNKEMFELQNDFQDHQYKPEIQKKHTNTNNTHQFSNTQEVNFQPVKDIMDTTQIKRPTKSGDHRNDINEKMNILNSTYFEPETYNSQPNHMLNKQSQSYQTTRNNSNYINNINNLQSSQSRNPQKEPTNQTNNFANYYNHNFDTLQIKKNTHMRYSNLDDTTDDTIDNTLDITSPEESYELHYNKMNQKNHINQQNTQNTQTHNNGIGMLNVRNMYSLNDFSQESTLNNRINDTGYHRIDEKKTDYRQNINNKLDNMIFDNPSAQSSLNPILQNSSGNTRHLQKDTRMVIQDSNKDYYRQSSNERMSQYSPLSRSSNIPIHMANMSVNDFYGNSNMGVSEMNKKIIAEEHNKLNSKEMLNNRLNNYTPLAKTVQYDTNQSQQNNIQQQQRQQAQKQAQQQAQKQAQQQAQKQAQQQSQQQSQQQRHQDQKQTHQQPSQQKQHQFPQHWNPLDVNSKLQNVVYNQLPIISNSERI